MKTSKKIRRLALALTITGSSVILTAGCVSPSGLALNSGKNTSPFQAVATSTKNAFGKSRDAVAGVVGRGSSQANSVAKKEVQSDVDPLRLDRKTDVGPEVFVANGRLWESTGNRQKAMESYTKALEAAPNDPKALASIARLHQSANNYPKAIEFFQKAIQQDPDDSVLHNDLGLTLSKSGNNPAAVASLTRALEIAPGTSRYANNLASVKFDIGKSDEALKVLLDNNKPAVAHYNMAYLYQEGGQLNEAKKHLNEAVKYKNQGQTDSSIARAVNRSQQMLAKIDSSRPSALPPNTAIAKTQLPKASAKQVMVRQTSQSVAKDGSANVKTAVAKESSSPTAGPSKRVNASFATARLGSKTVAVQKPAAKPADPPKTSGAFELPPGLFGETE